MYINTLNKYTMEYIYIILIIRFLVFPNNGKYNIFFFYVKIRVHNTKLSMWDKYFLERTVINGYSYRS